MQANRTTPRANTVFYWVIILLCAATIMVMTSCGSGVDLQEAITYTLTVGDDGNGTTVPSGAVQVEHGSATAVEAVPDDTYSFVNWTVTTGSGVTFDSIYAVSANVTLTEGDGAIQANFTQDVYQLTVTNDGHGTTSPSGTVQVVAGVPTGIVATATDEDYGFVEWSVEGGSGVVIDDAASSDTTVILTEGDATVKAGFGVVPVAAFHADITTGDDPLSVEFKDESTGDIDTWEWDFDNDGTVDSTLKDPVHVYTAPGNYTVSLTVTGPAGSDTKTRVNYIKVGGVPVAGFYASNRSGESPLTVDFTDTCEGDVWAWEWDFDNDGTVDSYSQNPRFTYDDPGIYHTVKMTVTGPAGSDAVIKTDYIKVHGWADVGTPGFSAGAAEYTSLYIDDGTPYVAYMDTANSDKATVMKYTGNITTDTDAQHNDGWEYVGTPGFTERRAEYISLYVYESTPYVAYQDKAYTASDGVEVMWFNNGTWEEIPITGFSRGTAKYISLYVYDGAPYVAYSDNYNDDKATMIRYNGEAWELLGGFGFSEDIVYFTSLYVYEGTPYVAYMDGADSDKATVMEYTGNVTTDTDAQVNDGWEYVGTPRFSAGAAYGTSLYVYEGTPYVAYVDSGNSDKATVMRFNGDTWEDVGTPGFSAVGPCDISLYVYEGTPYVAYRDYDNSEKAAVMKYSGNFTTDTDEQENDGWEYVGTHGFSAGKACTTSLCVYEGTPYVAYQDYANSEKATVMKCNCEAWEDVGAPGFSAGEVYFTSLYVYHGTPSVAYKDVANSDKATVMTFNGDAWEYMGTPGFSAGEARNESLYVYEGTPYLAYRDFANSGATVMRFNGGSWENVGTPGFSEGNVDQTSLYVYDGIPYVAYGDAEHLTYGATVMRFNGGSWENVGTPGFSAGRTYNTSLYVYNGTPYVAYDDFFNSGATVMEYTGNFSTDTDAQSNDGWEYVGTPGFSEGEVSYLSFYMYEGTPYMAYMDVANSDKATVMRFNGDTWEDVGTPGFSAGTVYSTSLYVYEGTPYVAYQDVANSSKATVMRFNEGAWEAVGTPGFSAGAASGTSLYMCEGIPYVAYKDVANSNKATVKKFW